MTMVIEPTEAQWEEIANYKMPKPQLGDMVVWYNNGDQTSEPKWGYVAKVDGRTIIIRKQALDEFNRCTESCRHASDPELQFKPNLRAKGTWDYHPAQKEREARLNWLEDRVKALEQRLTLQKCQTHVVEPDAKIEVTPEREQEIVDLAAEGKKPGQIAEMLGDISAQKIGLILKKTTLVPGHLSVA